MTKSTFGTILNHKGWSQSMLLKLPGFFAVELRLSQQRARSVRSIICSVRQNCAGAINLYILLWDFLILHHKHAYQQTDRQAGDGQKQEVLHRQQAKSLCTNRQTDIQASQPTSQLARQTDRQTDRQTGNQTGQPASQPARPTRQPASRQIIRQKADSRSSMSFSDLCQKRAIV